MESEERYRGIFEHAGTGIAIATLDGRFLSCNPAYSAMLGYTEDELGALVFPGLIHPDDREENLAKVKRLLAQEVQLRSPIGSVLEGNGHRTIESEKLSA